MSLFTFAEGVLSLWAMRLFTHGMTILRLWEKCFGGLVLVWDEVFRTGLWEYLNNLVQPLTFIKHGLKVGCWNLGVWVIALLSDWAFVESGFKDLSTVLGTGRAVEEADSYPEEVGFFIKMSLNHCFLDDPAKSSWCFLTNTASCTDRSQAVWCFSGRGDDVLHPCQTDNYPFEEWGRGYHHSMHKSIALVFLIFVSSFTLPLV